MPVRPTLVLAIFFVFASAFGAFAQTTGTIVGAVTDSTGAVVVGAEVNVVNTGTSFVTKSVTTAEGNYYLPYLNPGTYKLTIQASGFKQYVHEGIILRTNETPRFDVTLDLGNVNESVTVTGTAPLLETETATAGHILDGDTVVKIPVLQKAMYNIPLYMPGMNVIGGLSAVGQRQRALGYTLDGISAKEPVIASPTGFNTTITASLDSIQEFKLYTTGLPAEIGHSSGGQLSGVFKSGTNQLHGSMEDRYLNQHLFHRAYFDQVTNCQNVLNICLPFSYHEMGATIGGPVYIPKLYSGKDKTFFYFGFQRHHEKDLNATDTAVPTPEMYNGDFSFGGKGFPIYDPRSTTQLSNGTWSRTQFPGNKIPLSQFDPVAKNILAHNPWVPQTTVGVNTPSGVTDNLIETTGGRYYFMRFDAKIDRQFSANHRMFGRYSQVRNRNSTFPVQTSWLVATAPILIPIDQYNLVISDTYTINSTTVNEMRIGGNRRRSNRQPESIGGDWAKQLGIPNVPADTFPAFSPAPFGLGPGGQIQTVANDFSFQENLTKVLHKNTLKVGYEVIRTRYNSLPQALPSGQYNMGGTEFPFAPNTGNSFASFLLGSVSSAVFTQNTATWLPQWWSHALYAQTDYKPIRTMTLNIGIRWSYESPFETKYGQQSQFDPNAIDPISGLKGAIVHTKGPLAKSDLNNFQPRLGLAWQFKPKWVFRGNFGVSTADLMTSGTNQNFQDYLATANVQPAPGDPRTAFYLSQGPPAYTFNIKPDGSTAFLGTNYSARTADWYDPNMRMPYTMNWSSGFQYQMRNNWVVQAIYQGSAGVGLLNNWNINVLPLDVSKDFATLNQIRTQYQNFRPYPQFGTINLYSNFGHNTYHGATVSIDKRFSSGFTLNSFYTRSKSLDGADDDTTASGVTYFNRSLEKGRAGYDIQNRIVASFTYEIPVGKGRRFMNRGGWRNVLFGGWEMVWIQTLQTGQPFTVSFAGASNVYLPNMSLRPNQILPNDQAKLAHVDIGPNRFPTPAQKRYLNINAFSYPASFTPGTLGRNTLEGPGIFWAQASLSKQWIIYERLKFSLRADGNNITTYNSFNNPNSVYNATDPSTFGTFTGTRGSFSSIGTGHMHIILVFRLDW